MPRPKRTVRASGVARSRTGSGRAVTERCLCCGRTVPRTAIAHIGRKPFPSVAREGVPRLPRAFCGECWHSGAVWRGQWVVELEYERKGWL